MKEKFKLTSLEKSWILYDIGNSAFILLVSTLLPIYFNALASGAGISESDYLAYWGYAGSVATVLVAIIGPICGTMADWNYKKPLFLGSLALGAIGCAALGVAWGWLSFLVIFIIARVGYNCANVFYDSMLPEITTEARMDNVSTMGYALGYIGSVIPFALCLVLVLLHDTFGMSQATEGMTFHLFGLPVVNTGVAVGSIGILFIIGFILFCKADQLNKARQTA